MELKLTPQESEEIFFNALCNGLQLMPGYGLELDYDQEEYKLAKAALLQKNQNVCFEDVLMEMLRRGEWLTLVDVEGDGEYTNSIRLTHIHKMVEQVAPVHILNYQEEQDDADDADAVLQTVFFGEMIFG
jgi:hypothetical protein